ncbi:MAG: ankyrin repeat domain-containing protein [Desulfuromonadaceae bacterium]|nr:ankyrin repeat domain-containing protein [Desulfuromonadaceae bacterium]
MDRNMILRSINTALIFLLLSACTTTNIFTAVQLENVQEVNRLLDSGVSVNIKGGKDATPLYWAASNGSMKIAGLLIDHGAEIDARNSAGFTPLFASAYWSSKDVSALLISKGANVNAKSNSGWTPLHKAIERYAYPPDSGRSPPPSANELASMMEIVKLLIANGADVNAESSDGETPLIFAAAAGRSDLVELLIAHNANINSKGNEGVSALYMATIMDRLAVAKLLLEHGAKVDSRTKSGYTPLMYAARIGNYSFTEMLIAHGADVNASDFSNKWHPLAWALSYAALSSSAGQKQAKTQMNHSEFKEYQSKLKFLKREWHEVAQSLVNHGADVKVTDINGDSPLYLAALIGDAGLVELFLNHGASLDDARSGETPLHGAIAEHHRDVAELLINRGANVTIKNMSGRTPLHFLAALMDDQNLAEMMISRGAGVNAKDKSGYTPLEMAVKAGNKQVASVLRKYGAK